MTGSETGWDLFSYVWERPRTGRIQVSAALEFCVSVTPARFRPSGDSQLSSRTCIVLGQHILVDGRTTSHPETSPLYAELGGIYIDQGFEANLV